MWTRLVFCFWAIFLLLSREPASSEHNMASWSRDEIQKCPVCPAMSKFTYDEIGLFQHAIAISKCNANPEIVHAHRILLNNLNGRLNNFATSSDGQPLLHGAGMNMGSQHQKNAISVLGLPDKGASWNKLHYILQEKDMKLMQLGKEIYNLQTLVYQSENEKHSAKAEFLLKERKHKQELETVNEKLKKATESHDDDSKEKINSLQIELRDFQEKCRRLEENNTQSTADETLIPKLIDLIEEKEGLQDTVEKLIYKEREVNDKYQSAMAAAKEVLEIKGNTKSIGIKRVGVMNYEPWKKACAQRFKDHKEGWETPCASLVSVWEDEYLRDPSWFPYKVVTTEGGKFEEHIDANDERLAKLSQDFGAEVYKTVVDALNELREFNASGRYPISVPWNFEHGRAARLDEIIQYLALDSPKKRKCSLG